MTNGINDCLGAPRNGFSTPTLILSAGFIVVQLAQLLLVILFEKIEYDTFTFYFSKVEIMRWWTLNHHPLISSVQEFLPIGYSKLQMLFAGNGYGRNALNFIVALGGALYFRRHLSTTLYFLFLFLALANTAFFMQYTGYKTDAPLAVISIVLIHIVSRDYFRFQLSAITCLTLLVLSIKWSGGIVVATAALLYLPTLLHTVRYRSHELAEDFLLSLILIALLFGYLELGTYIDAFRKTGSFAPTQTFGVAPLDFRLTYLWVGLAQYLLVSIVETFEPLWRQFLHFPGLGPFIGLVTLGAKDHIILSPGELRQGLNIFDALGLAASAFVLLQRRMAIDRFIRNCALGSLIVTAAVLATYPYQPYYANRYFLSAQLLSYIPLAFLATAILNRVLLFRESPARAVTIFAVVLSAVHIGVSAFMLVKDHERNLRWINAIPEVKISELSNARVVWLKPIYMLDDFERTVGGSPVYLALHQTMTAADPLEIVTDTHRADADYTYLFLRERSPSNTTLADIQNGGFAPGAKNVLCFSATACEAVAKSGAYSKIADQGHLAFWRSQSP